MISVLERQQRLVGFEKLRNQARMVLGYIADVKQDRRDSSIEDGYQSAVYTMYQVQRLPEMTRARVEGAIKVLRDGGREFSRLPAEKNALQPHTFSHADVRAIYKAAGQRSFAEIKSTLGSDTRAKVVACQNLKGGWQDHIDRYHRDRFGSSSQPDPSSIAGSGY